MESLVFTWSAIFADGSKIEQFENGIEHRFQEVKDKFNDLCFFNLKNNEGAMFSVNLMSGLIGYNILEFPYIDAKEKKENIRLIYFRRHQVDTTEGGAIVAHRVWYFLGYQYNDNNGNNRKVILKIDSNGNFLIES